jgi:serine/threonine protein kinase
MEYLHANDIGHRDIKAANVLLDADGNCKLIDFGLSKERFAENDITESMLGTVAYLPPEIANECPYTRKCDSYTMGTLLYEMLVGKPPFMGRTREQMLTNIKTGVLDIPSRISEQIRNLLSCLLERDSNARLPISRIRDHPLFHGTNWKAVIERRVPVPPFRPYAMQMGPPGEPFPNDSNRHTTVEGWNCSFVN